MLNPGQKFLRVRQQKEPLRGQINLILTAEDRDSNVGFLAG